MFLRIAASLMLLLTPLCLEGTLITTDRYGQKDAETDIAVLKSILSRHPDDLKTLKRLVNLTFSMEYFEQTEKYCEQYLAIQKNSDAAYIKILAAASMGKFKSAADQVDPFIAEYKKELSRRDIYLLKYRKNIYGKSDEVKSYPAKAVKTAWGSDYMLKSLIARDNLFTVYKFSEQKHSVLKINAGTSAPSGSYPEYLSGLPGDSVNFVSLSDDGREMLAGAVSGDSSGIYIRRFIPAEKKWSSWIKPGGLNPCKWNHYPNFVNSSTVIFSSSQISGDSDYDIYISRRDKNGDWGRAEKLEGINTPLDEISVWAHPDGETIYFSSNGYRGMGGFDIYGARLLQKGNSFEVSGITNISSANTFRNEKHPLFVTLSGGDAYFNFAAGKTRDVYSCRDIDLKPSPVFFYTADLVDDSTGIPVGGASVVFKTSPDVYSREKISDTDGFTGTALRRNMKYVLTISAEGYEPFSKTVSFAGEKEQVADQIRLKIKNKKTPASEDSKNPKNPETSVTSSGRETVILITAIKLIECEKGRALPVQKTLDAMTGSGIKGGRIISSPIICGDSKCASNEGKKVNADYVVFGTLIKKEESAMKTLGNTGEDQYLAQKVTGEAYILELKLIETATDKVVVSYKKSTRKPESLKNIADEFIRKAESFYKKKD